MVAQKDRAPLVFVIAGTGASHRSPKVQILQKALYQAGFHVLSLPSTTHPNFIAAASSTGAPGPIVPDSRDLYRVMELAWEQVKRRVEVTNFYLTGYSLGAAQAAFVSKLDEEQHSFNFKKVLMINPPVSLYNSVVILDGMLTDNIPGGLDNFNSYFNELMEAFTEVYKTQEFVEFNDEFLYAVYRERTPPDERVAALIGMSFRISSANMVFTSDVYTNFGFLTPKNHTFSTTESLTDYFKVAARTSLADSIEEYVFPYYQEKDPGLTLDELIEGSSLNSIESYLASSDKIALMHNEDDLIMAPGEIDYLRQVFQSRAQIYPRGGHCGNMDHRDNVDYLTRFFAN